ncbi:MAG: hypothetical protein LAT64_11585 [Phycisphaerales bacterium]|nr:hypothetical protein [Planctomycetota bacterium]MCH8509393.1 hypothetical protein [Phycisphaerales bacterium]
MHRTACRLILAGMLVFLAGAAGIPAADDDHHGVTTMRLLSPDSDHPPGITPRPGGQGDAYPTAMRTAGHALHALRRSALDATSREMDLANLQSLQRSLVDAKESHDTAPVPPGADDDGTHARRLHLALIDALGASLDLERAVLEGRHGQAPGLLEGLCAVRVGPSRLFAGDE